MSLVCARRHLEHLIHKRKKNKLKRLGEADNFSTLGGKVTICQ